MQDASSCRFSELQKAFFGIALLGNLQFNFKGISKNCLLCFFRSYAVYGNVLKICLAPLKIQTFVVLQALDVECSLMYLHCKYKEETSRVLPAPAYFSREGLVLYL